MNAGKFRVFVKNLFVAGSLLALASRPANADLIIGISFPSQGGGDNDVVEFDSSDAFEIDESLLTLPKLRLQDTPWFGPENRIVQATITIEFSSEYIEHFTNLVSPSYSYSLGSTESDQAKSYPAALAVPGLPLPKQVLPLPISLSVSRIETPNSSAASDSSISGPVSVTAPSPAGLLTVTLNQNTLKLDWPADHIGWLLQTQTNPGINSQWFPIPGSSATNHLDLTLDRANTSVFFRLVAP
jgi:hypothetical protein